MLFPRLGGTQTFCNFFSHIHTKYTWPSPVLTQHICYSYIDFHPPMTPFPFILSMYSQKVLRAFHRLWGVCNVHQALWGPLAGYVLLGPTLHYCRFLQLPSAIWNFCPKNSVYPEYTAIFHHCGSPYVLHSAREYTSLLVLYLWFHCGSWQAEATHPKYQSPESLARLKL